ncbi:MAG: hypothetical protein M1834_008049 [Cirrosporium novae-zelandiae]|nr:MAG: hypothetical protein M1834_008049 [Cirrosporium novae-zelandiae]
MVKLTFLATMSIALLATAALAMPAEDKKPHKTHKPTKPKVTIDADSMSSALAAATQTSDSSAAATTEAPLATDVAAILSSLLNIDTIPTPTAVPIKRQTTLEPIECQLNGLIQPQPPSNFVPTVKAATLAALFYCKLWFPGDGIYYLAEGTNETSPAVGHLVFKYGVRSLPCNKYKPPSPGYWPFSQNQCIEEMTSLIKATSDVCFGDMTGVSNEGNTAIPIWMKWYSVN